MKIYRLFLFFILIVEMFLLQGCWSDSTLVKNYPAKTNSEHLPDLIPYRKGKHWGYINKKGEIIIPFHYEDAYPFSNNLARVLVKDGLFSTHWQFIDKHGKTQIKFDETDSPDDFIQGLARVRKQVGENRWKEGLIDVNGKLIVPFDYDHVLGHSEGRIMVEKNGKVGFLDVYGEEIIPCIFHLCGSFKNGYTWFQKIPGGQCGYINLNGEVVIPPTYDRWQQEEFSEDLVAVKRNSLWGYSNSKDSLYIPIMYDQAKPFKNGTAWTKLDNKWGLINKQNKVIIPFKYKDIKFWDSEIVGVLKDDKWGFINLKDSIILRYQYNELLDGFKKDKAVVKLTEKDSLFTLIDIQGSTLARYKFEHFEAGFFNNFAIFSNEYFAAHNKKHRIHYWVSYDGEVHCKGFRPEVFHDHIGRSVYMNAYVTDYGLMFAE